MALNYQELEEQYAPMIETLNKEINTTKIYLADLENKRRELINEYIRKGVSAN